MALLRELIQPAQLERCGDRSFPVLSMTMHDGIMLQSDRFKKSLASVDQSAYKVVRRNQLVVGFPIDEGVLYIQQVVDAGIMSPAYDVWNVDEMKVDLRYFELCLHSPQSMMFYKTNLRGTTARRRSLPKETLLSLPVPVPSMERQREIASALDRLQALIRLRQHQLCALDQLIKARFVEMFGDILSNYVYPKKRLSDVVTVGSSKRIFAAEYVNEGTPFYRSKEIRELGSGLKPSVELYISPDRYDEIKKHSGIPKKGDILIAAIGATIGYSWIVNTDDPFYYKDGNLLILSISDKVNSVFLNHVMAILIDDYKTKGAAGSAQLALTIEKVEKMEIPYPPMSVQDEFATFVSQVGKSKLSIQASLDQLETLKQSLMQKYFG